ncbi:MAG TPA: MEDS domain-containing protein [Mucilaginibacter sp.]|jgi:C4-dicarboxylate-specific signal transduction histidine kinase|nr:MEDS domain-containing protein [Mucilaginibacter sp.]
MGFTTVTGNNMTEDLRPTGIDVIGDIPWGTHFCHFYQTKQDLLSILVAFFKAGLENNEYCLWITAPHISVDEALSALEEAVPEFDHYLRRGIIEIVTNSEWYQKDGKLDLERAIQTVSDRLRIALQQNCEGLRANGDESWLDRKEWKDFIAYERELNPLIAEKHIIILCAYPLANSVAAKDILDIVYAHEFTVAKRDGRLEILETPEIKKSKAQLQQQNEMLEMHLAEKTKELAKTHNILGKSQSRLRAIFNTTDIAFLLLDSDLHVLTYNSIANHWSQLSFGTTLKEGVDFIGLLKDDRKGPVKEMLDAAMVGNPVSYEANYPYLDGPGEWYCISINPVKDPENNIIGLCCSATNITTSKLAELERNRISSDLVHRNKDLEQFAYIVSHNLRAPLANIISLSRMLRQGDLSTHDKAESEEFLFQSITKLDEIVNDLNQILQVRRDIGETKEKVVFSELVNYALTGFRQLITQANINVITDFASAESIHTIKSYLYSIFYNLISNSIKYRQPEIPLVMEIRSRKRGKKIVLTFKDNARGIDLSAKGEEVFGLYKRFHTDTEGKGLGLYMVKTQVEALGGDISISSQPNIGTTFSIELPGN